MGNVDSVVKEEFKRVKDKQKDRNYLLLDELLLIQPPRDCTINSSHLGTLFVIDKKLTGRFYEEDILEFAKIYASQELLNGRKDDFKSKFQAYCTLKMWNEISKSDGLDLFVEWFCKLLTENPNNIQTFKQHPDTIFLTIDAIKKMYQILSIKSYYGGDFRSFLDLMQRTAEEQNILKLDEDELDDVVPLQVLKMFSKDFINGFIKLMSELGFQQDMLLE
ncbi:hypothetical protein DLAC_10648 [Tieghemostelium lacteum]|uniref:Uncharacterized protein n=1 Tax=Tieghemostelium lacteum TaxID=361077 RepID=A0A151Z4G5_TIELA|nr:hypothetical protein DLAC_10648 [Tieghemostelium lacteum]|eukprot:KYQ88846.1 hypothetical protein DLAC_10648 [Tieghemostelium lacteum]